MLHFLISNRCILVKGILSGIKKDALHRRLDESNQVIVLVHFAHFVIVLLIVSTL